MKLTNNLKKTLQAVFVLLLALLVIGLVYYGSIPQRYSLTPGVVSSVDIAAPRSVEDTNATEKRANESKLSVAPIYVRSDVIAQKCAADLSQFFSICKTIRDANVNPDGSLKQT